MSSLTIKLRKMIHFSLIYLSIIILLASFCNVVNCQRNIPLWKGDLNFRLESYIRRKDALENLFEASKKPMTLNGNVNFKQLVISPGSLILKHQVTRANAKVLANKTQNYLNSKLTEIQRLTNVLQSIHQQFNNPDKAYVFKGRPSYSSHKTIKFFGPRMLRQLQYARIIQSGLINLHLIDGSLVQPIIDRAYMKNLGHSLFDSQGRLYFEGSKTLLGSVFLGDLHSGCCGRLRPLHTDRLLTRTTNQVVSATVLLKSVPSNPVYITNLGANQFRERVLSVGLLKRPTGNSLLKIMSSMVNYVIRLEDLINIRSNFELIPKSLVFSNTLLVENAHIITSLQTAPKILIGSKSRLFLELTPDSYLLKYRTDRRYDIIQRFFSHIIIESETTFMRELNTIALNEINDFVQFVAKSLTRIDRPYYLRKAQFSALPSIFSQQYNLDRTGQNFVLLTVDRDLTIGRLNRMKLPDDLILNNRVQQPNRVIVISGPLLFTGSKVSMQLVNVQNFINGIAMPASVIPLHLNDAIHQLGSSNIFFSDGITANQIIVQNRQFDKLQFNDVMEDADSFLMRSTFVQMPDGMQLINGKINVRDVKFIQSGLKSGLLNNFRPEEILHPGQTNQDSIYGRRFFATHVEAADCYIQGMNNMYNWTNHLIRINRPNSVQTIDTHLVFTNLLNNPLFSNPSSMSSVNIDSLFVNFLPNLNQANYITNFAQYPQLWTVYQAIFRETNQNDRRYKVGLLRLMNPKGMGFINGIHIDQVVRLDQLNVFHGRYVMVGKVEIMKDLNSNIVTSNYPIDAIDLVQFKKYRVPLIDLSMFRNFDGHIKLNNLILSGRNELTFIKFHLINGVVFNQYINSIMSLTRPQIVQNPIVFNRLINFAGPVKTNSTLNNIDFVRSHGNRISQFEYEFKDGLECQSVVI